MRFLSVFSVFYDKVLEWSSHPKASRYLAFVSFVDSSVFPVSPLFMLLPMAYAKPERAFGLAWTCIVWSVLGGIIGYFLGFFAFEVFLEPFINRMGYAESYRVAMVWFQEWGFWAIFLACLSPIIPYKIFTIAAGVLQLNFPGFLVASFLGRSLRFFLIAAVIRFGGPKVEPFVRRTLARLR